jgi:hypothetical protein
LDILPGVQSAANLTEPFRTILISLQDLRIYMFIMLGGKGEPDSKRGLGNIPNDVMAKYPELRSGLEAADATTRVVLA